MKTLVLGTFIYIWNIRDFWKNDILILVHYIVCHSLFVLETGLFQFVKLYDKALRSIALLLWLTTLNRSLQAFCLALLTLTTGNDLFMSLVIHPSDVTHAALVFSLATLDKSILISYFDCEI